MASVRLLDKVAPYTTKQWDDNYKGLRKQLKKFREEVGAIPNKLEAVQAVSKVDGYISLPIVMEILEEIQKINSHEVRDIFQQLTNKQFDKVISKDTLRAVFKKQLGQDVRDIFEKMVDATRMVDLTEEKVREVISAAANTIFDKAMLKYLKEGVTPEAAKEKLLPLICTELYIICATELYNEADKRQTANWFTIKAYMGPYLLKPFPAEALQNPFIAVRECAKLINIDMNTGKLWREAALWLEGLYVRSFLQVPEKYRQGDQVIKTEQDKMPLADPADKEKNEKDKQFQDNFGLTLYEMALFHHQTAIVIESHFMPRQVVQAAQPEVAPTSAAAAVSLPVANKNENAAPSAQPAPLESVIPDAQLRMSLSSNLMFKPPAPAAEVKGVTFEMLDNLNNEEPEVQFTLFLSYLKRYKLTEEQKDLFNEYSEVITSSLDEYINSRWSSNGIPTLFRNRPHAAEAAVCKQSILEAKTPYDQIKILFDFWKELKGNASWDLRTKVASCISHAVTVLFKDAKMRKESQIRLEAK